MASEFHPVALVTGASRGIGRAIAAKLAARGATVALHYHQNGRAADEALQSLAGSGHAKFQADLTDQTAATTLAEAVIGRFGRIDVLVNNAGVYEHHALTDQGLNFDTWEVIWERTLAANLTSPAHLIFHAARRMQSNGPSKSEFGRGRIVNISSRGAFRGEPRAPAYGASKAGLNAMGQSLARALAPEQVYVFTLAPGWVDTDMSREYLEGPQASEIRSQHPMGRVATAEEVASAAAWVAFDAPPSMTGSIIDVNGASYLRT